MAIIYIWGYNPPAPQQIGNATRAVGIDRDDEAKTVANDSADFDVEMLNRDGKPAWAAAYITGEYETADVPFEPGVDVDKFEGCSD